MQAFMIAPSDMLLGSVVFPGKILNGVVSTPQLKLITWLALLFSTFALVTGQFKRSYVKP